MAKSIGIIGGMGPLATADLFRKIISWTDAKNDQEHIHVYIDNNTCIPDRTAAILHKGENPLPQMVWSAKKLEKMGADFLVLPCNTAHYFYEPLCEQVGIPILHMIQETAKELKEQGIKRAGLLATEGTIHSGIYEETLLPQGIEPLTPNGTEQKAVMHLIYDNVKAGKPLENRQIILNLLDNMQNRGAQTFILGCTELPIAFMQNGFAYPAIDPTTVLARKAVLLAKGTCRQTPAPV